MFEEEWLCRRGGYVKGVDIIWDKEGGKRNNERRGGRL